MMIVKGQDPLVNTDRFELDPEKGVINIGSDEENDIVIHHPSVRPFHMMVSYRDKTYQIFPLDPQAEISLRGVPIRTDSAIPVKDLNDISFGSFSFTPALTSSSDQANESFAIVSIADENPENANFDSLPVPLMFSAQNVSAPVFPSAITPLPKVEQITDISDEVILVELLETGQTIDVEQTASYHLNIINGGPIVAGFDVAVEGVPPEWVFIQPPRVNLFEGGKAFVTVTITPPRRPSSQAGEYPLLFKVTSPNHPGRQATKKASLTIAPYYDFGISEVSPLRKVIPWRKRFGEVEMDVRNRGNSPAHLHLVAQDDGNECQFQFLASNGLMQLAQVEYNVPAGETQVVPIHISPLKRSLIRFSAKQHPYRVSVSQPENETLSLFTMGTAIARPMIGILGLLLILTIIAGVTVFLFSPRIITFEADNSVIGVGESTTLHWKTFFFTHDLSISGVNDPVNSSNGSIEIFPAETVNTYQLTATTWLWKMLNLEPKQRTFTVLAVPSEPSINTFVVGDNDVLVGDTLLLRWSVTNANKVLLTVNGVSDIFENSEDFNGERNLFIDSDTLVTIEAINAIGSVVDSEYIQARPPSIVIKKFEVDKTSIYKGEQVTIIWEIEGTGMGDGGQVMISAFESALPLKGELTFFPEESMEFVLTVNNREAKEVRILPVGVLDPAAPPEAPTINFFTAAPETLVGPGKVELAWSVTGAFQTISITNGTTTVATGLPAQGFRTIDVSASGTYVITAINQDQSAGKELTITVNPDLLEADLAVVSISKTTSLSIGSSTIVGITCESPNADDPPPTGTVVVSDGTASCTMSLPVTSCELEFVTPGDKLITATYMGDSNYIQSESEAYTPSFYVMGNDLGLDIAFNPNTGPFYFGQKVDLKVFAIGSNPIRNPLGTIMLKRVCDSTANYLVPCAATQEGLYTLKAEDGGLHIFEDLVIDQLGGKYGLQVIYTEDNYYDDNYKTVTWDVSGTILSPLSFSTSTDLSTPYNIGSIPLIVTVMDANTSSLFSVPKGYVEVSALHSDGTTRITCAPEQANLSQLDERSSRGTCTLTPTKAGDWTISTTFVPVSDIWHTSESGVLGTVAVNAGVNIGLVNPPADLTTFAETILTLNVLRTDFNTQVATGTLACSATSSTCSCSYNEDNINWKCTIKPSVSSVTSSTSRTVSFTYTPVTGQFLNSATKSQTFKIIKADTTALMSTPATLASYYIVDSELDVTIVADHASGGDDPTGSNNVTIQLGSGTCNTSTGMASPITEVTASLGSPKNFKLGNAYNTGTPMRFCYQYTGDGDTGAYNRSPWVSSTDFLVRNTFTVLTITAQPTAGGTTLTVGNNASLTVNVANSEGGASPNAGDINFQLGSGTCNASSGMTTGVIGTITDGTLSGGSSLTKTVPLTSAHAVGADIRFCVRYEGQGKYGASSWVASEAFRVKAQPAIGAVNPVEVVLSPNMNDFSNFTVSITNGVSLDPTKITLVDASNTTICAGTSSGTTTTNYKCEYISVSGNDYQFRIASKLPGVLSLTPAYTADERNLAAAGTAVNVTSQYEITWTTQPVSVKRNLTTANPNFLTFSSFENVVAYDEPGEYMVTFIKAAFAITNYTAYDNAVFELTPRIMKVINNVDSGLLTTESAGCAAIGSTFGITCSETKVDDANTAGLRIVLEPSSAKSSYYKAAQLSSNYATVSVIENVVETPSDSTYALTIGCPKDAGDGFRYFTITGFTGQQLTGSSAISHGNFEVQLECVYAAAKDYCYLFYDTATDPGYFSNSAENCESSASFNNLDLEVTWQTVGNLQQFTLAVGKNVDFGGCPGRGGIIEQRANLRFYYNDGTSDYEDFTFEYSKEGDSACKDD